MYAGSYGRINTCFTRNQDMNIHQQAVQGARFFDLDTKQTRTGRLFAVHSIAYGDELTVVSVILLLALFTYFYH